MEIELLGLDFFVFVELFFLSWLTVIESLISIFILGTPFRYPS
jgi:hypothetical protein